MCLKAWLGHDVKSHTIISHDQYSTTRETDVTVLGICLHQVIHQTNVSSSIGLSKDFHWLSEGFCLNPPHLKIKFYKWWKHFWVSHMFKWRTFWHNCQSRGISVLCLWISYVCVMCAKCQNPFGLFFSSTLRLFFLRCLVQMSGKKRNRRTKFIFWKFPFFSEQMSGPVVQGSTGNVGSLVRILKASCFL